MGTYAAKPFVAGTPEAIVAGQTVSAFLDNLQAEEIAPILPKYGLENIDPDKWYPHQAWLDVLHEISTMDNASTNLVAFGKKVVQTAVMPPEIDSIPSVLNLLHTIHHLNLQNVPEEEGYAIEEVGPNHYHVYHNTPNPSDAIYGFLWGLVARYKAQNEVFIVREIRNPNPAQNPGTLFDVRWGDTLEELR